MTSKLVVNTIEADTGISSVSFASSISMNSTAKFHFSAAGVDIGADTNINRPAAGVLGFNINSSEKVRITSAGHLGVGDNNPDTRLSVTAASGTDVVGKFTSTDANAWIQFRDNTTTDTGVMVGANGDNLLLRAGSNERLRILSNGNVLIGTTVDGNQALNVYGASNAAIVIQNSNTGTGANNGLYIGNGNGTIGYVWNYENDSMRFATNNTERLRINSNGSIQITPEGSTSNPYMLIDTSGDSVRFSAQKGSGNNEFRFLTQSSGTVTEKLRITSAGRLAILNNDENIDMDSSSNGQFQIDGNGYVGAITMNATGMFLYHNSNSRIIGIGVNETEVGRFTTGGYEQRFSNTSTYSTTTGSRKGIYAVSYTHLTLPTKRIV